MLCFALLLLLGAVSAKFEATPLCKSVQSDINPFCRPPYPSYVVPGPKFDLLEGVKEFRYTYNPPCANAVLEVTACDVVTPKVYLHKYKVKVVRQSDLIYHAVVTSKYYCPQPLRSLYPNYTYNKVSSESRRKQDQDDLVYLGVQASRYEDVWSQHKHVDSGSRRQLDQDDRVNVQVQDSGYRRKLDWDDRVNAQVQDSGSRRKLDWDVQVNAQAQDSGSRRKRDLNDAVYAGVTDSGSRRKLDLGNRVNVRVQDSGSRRELDQNDRIYVGVQNSGSRRKLSQDNLVNARVQVSGSRRQLNQNNLAYAGVQDSGYRRQLDKNDQVSITRVQATPYV